MISPGTYRRTFSGSGRKLIVPKPREPNGQHVRALKEETMAEARATVMAQRHRISSPDQRRRWPIGRMILDKIVKTDDPNIAERVAERYANAWADVRWVMDSKRPFFNASGYGRREATEEDRRTIEAEWGNINRVLRDCDPTGRGMIKKAMDFVILDASPDFDERTFGTWIPRSCSIGIAALVDYWGMET